MKINQPQFGERLRARRIELGLSQKALGGDVVTPSYISLLERGDRIPTLDVVVHLAQVLNTAVANLLDEDAQEALAGSYEAGHEHLVRLLDARGYAETGDLEAAHANLEIAFKQLRERNASDERVLDVGIQLSNVLHTLGDNVAKLALIDELLTLHLVQQTVEFQLPLMTDRMSSLRELSRVMDALMLGWHVLDLFTSSPMAGGREHVRALGVVSSLLCELDEYASATEIIERMLQIAEALDQPGAIGRASWLASMAYARMGKLDLARGLLDRARRSLSFATMPTLEWLRLCRSTASVLLLLGDLADAEEWIKTAEITATMTGLKSEQAAVVRERARYALATGDAEAAAQLFGSLTEPGSGLVGLDLIMALFGLANALQQLGRNREAAEVFRRGAVLCDEMGNYRRAAEAWRRVDELSHADGV